MSAHRNEEKASAMTSAYQTGLSLAQVAALFDVTRQAVYKMLARRHVNLRKKKPRDSVQWRGETYSERENGYYAKTTGDREYLHRAVWETVNGPLEPGEDVHHIDEDKKNNDLSNLAKHTRREHGRRHGFGGNQHTGSLGRRPVKW